MTEDVLKLLASIENESLLFNDVLDYIDNDYLFKPTEFTNGEKYNSETQNQGSAKVFCFAKFHSLNENQTLILFAEHYRSVLLNPDGQDHENIRNFIKYGWNGVLIKSSLIPNT